MFRVGRMDGEAAVHGWRSAKRTHPPSSRPIGCRFMMPPRIATGRPLTSSNAPLATLAGRAHRCTAGRMSRTTGLALRPFGLGLGRCHSWPLSPCAEGGAEGLGCCCSWPLSSCSQGGCCSLAARASSVAKQQAARRPRIEQLMAVLRAPPSARPPKCSSSAQHAVELRATKAGPGRDSATSPHQE